MSQADHIMHRGARRVHRDGQYMRGLGAAMAVCAIETTTAHCHHGHVAQVPPPRPLLIPQHEPLPIVLDWQAPYRYQFMGVRVGGLPMALTVKP
jgi:hypothetical protein